VHGSFFESAMLSVILIIFCTNEVKCHNLQTSAISCKKTVFQD